MIELGASISLVPQLKCGPFLFWDGLAESCRQAADAGFDAVEVLYPSPDAIDAEQLHDLLEKYQLKLTGMGTGAGYLVDKLHLCSPDVEIRERAEEFIAGIIDIAGMFKAFAIIGSMKGSIEPGVARVDALNWLTASLSRLGERAKQYNVPLIVEPLNRYETNFINRLEQGIELIHMLSTENVKLLADLFHMNIEEVSVPQALQQAARYIGHIHFVDSNRRPPGCGHIDFAEIGEIIREIGYHGFVSAEALPYPDSMSAARQTVHIFREHILES